MDYYISQGNGQQQGPFKREELMRMGLTPSTLVWRQGMSQWMAASAMPELSDLFVAPAPLPAPAPVPIPKASQPSSQLLEEIEKSKRELEEIRQQIEKLQPDNLESLIQPPIKLKEKTPYDFRCPTWTKEAWIVLACVAGHFFLGITGITKFFYIFLDLIGFALCFAALYIGSKIKTLNKVSYAQGTPTREKGDKLARINGWLVSITALIGIIIILVHSGLDMFSEGLETGITYTVIYIVIMGLLWYTNFRPIKLDNYPMKSSPTLSANARQKKMEEADLLRWRRERRRHGLSAHLDSDDSDDDGSDWDSDDLDDDGSDWDDDDDGDDWGGGDSGGGGADSEW
jgi:hypothetical protein